MTEIEAARIATASTDSEDTAVDRLAFRLAYVGALIVAFATGLGLI